MRPALSRPGLSRPGLSRPGLSVTLAVLLSVPLLAAPASLAPALADEVTGTLVAHDRKARRLVMDDRTVYEYAEETERPETMLAGTRLKITYRGGEDGIESISRIETVE